MIRIKKLLSIIIAGFVAPTVAFASWVKTPEMHGQCLGELFRGSKVQPIVWKNKLNSLSICAFSTEQKSDSILMNDSFEVKMEMRGQSLIIASEPEAGANPLRIDFNGDKIKFTTYHGRNGVRVYTQEVSCREKCEVSKKVCALKHDPRAEGIMDRLEKEFKKATTEKAQRKLWARYFFEGSDLKEGTVLIAEAMLGSQRAEKLILNAPGADAGLSEAAGAIGINIAEVRKICALAR